MGLAVSGAPAKADGSSMYCYDDFVRVSIDSIHNLYNKHFADHVLPVCADSYVRPSMLYCAVGKG